MTPDDRVQAFWAMLRYNPTAADCTLCLSQLEAYVQMQLNWPAAAAEFGWLRQHLDSCPACAEAYGLLYELVWTEENGRLPQPPHIPDPDLLFLRPLVVRPPPDWLKPFKDALQVTPAQIRLQLNETLASLLTPSPAPAPTRTTGDGRYQPKLLELTPDQAQSAAVPFSLTAYADQQQPDRCLVEITVQPPGQSWPDLGGNQVAVTAAGQTIVAATDDWGTAVFPDLPRNELETLAIIVPHN
jgi:hypothetical protein